MMKQPLLVLSGMKYDYCNEIILNKMIGFLDQNLNIFTGIEVSEQECDIKDVKAIQDYLLTQRESKKLRFVCGMMGEDFCYYGLDFSTSDIQFGKTSLNQDGYQGSLQVFHEGKELILQNRFYVSAYTTHVEGEEDLAFATEALLDENSNNLTWRGIQYAVEAKAMEQNPEYQKQMQIVPSNR